jgi:hypothetical protein
LPGLSGQPIFFEKEKWIARMKRAMTTFFRDLVQPETT